MTDLLAYRLDTSQYANYYVLTQEYQVWMTFSYRLFETNILDLSYSDLSYNNSTLN